MNMNVLCFSTYNESSLPPAYNGVLLFFMHAGRETLFVWDIIFPLTFHAGVQKCNDKEILRIPVILVIIEETQWGIRILIITIFLIGSIYCYSFGGRGVDFSCFCYVRYMVLLTTIYLSRHFRVHSDKERERTS